MIVLGIETATAVCAAAVIHNDAIAAESFVEAPQVHAEKLLVLIDDVLRQSATEKTALDGIAVSIGPGSFTGLRIGLSAAKGLALALAKPILAVPTLEALALSAMRQTNCRPGTSVAAVIESRRDEVFMALYDANDEIMPLERKEPAAYTVAEAAALVERLTEVVLAGSGVERLLPVLPAARLGTSILVPAREHRQCSAGAVGMLGAARLLRGETADAATIEPYYIKEFYTTAKPVHNPVQ